MENIQEPTAQQRHHSEQFSNLLVVIDNIWSEMDSTTKKIGIDGEYPSALIGKYQMVFDYVKEEILNVAVRNEMTHLITDSHPYL